MDDTADTNIQIFVETIYIDEQSIPDQNRYVFAYTITIKNLGDISVKLLSRYWLITDANNKIQEVRGEGVIGLQPNIRPGQSFTYTSGAIIETPIGCMQGNYFMTTEDGAELEATIPVFRLSSHVTMH
jgi:ApaG protein